MTDKPAAESIEVVTKEFEKWKAHPHWYCYRRELEGDVWKKVEYQAQHPLLKLHRGQPKDWTKHALAVQSYRDNGFDGIGCIDHAPKPLIVNLENIPDELKRLPNWVLWMWTIFPNELVWKKIPYQPEFPDYMAGCNRPSEWSDFDLAVKVYNETRNRNGSRRFDGLMFSLDSLYVGVDFDNVRPDSDPKRIEIISESLKTFNSYVEQSPSGTGLHVLMKGDLSRAFLYTNDMNFEIYKNGRFLTVTGQAITPRRAIEERQEAIDQFHSTHFKARSVYMPKVVEPGAPNAIIYLSNHQIVNMIFNSKFGGKFIKLYQGDFSDWHDSKGDPDESRADYYFCRQVAWYTQDMDQILSIVRDSGIWRVPKWERQDYIDITITNAINSHTYFYTGRYRKP